VRRFESGGECRYVWDPVVHARHGEDCYFYLIRAADPESHTVLTTELNHLLRREDITSHSIYGVFGHHDALVRLWATETVRRRFLRALTTSVISPEELLEFRAEDIYYSFASSRPSLAEVKAHDRQASIVVRAEVEDSWGRDDPAEGAFDTLLKSSQIHEVPVIAGIKVYLVLSREHSSVGTHRPEEVRRLREEMAKAGFSSVSVYSGYGTIGDHLVKGIADVRFGSLWDMLSPVHKAASELGLRSMTLVIANMDSVVEADTLDNLRTQAIPLVDELLADIAELSKSGDREIELLRTRVRELTLEQRNALLGYFSQISDGYRGTILFERLVDLLRASLLNDSDAVITSVSFVTSIELEMRKCIAPLAREALGENWFSILIGQLDLPSRDRESSGANLTRLTLHDLFAALRALAETDRQVYDTLSAALGQRWSESFRTVEELRNNFAHGRLVDRAHFTDFDLTWGSALSSILAAARLSLGLRELRFSLQA